MHMPPITVIGDTNVLHRAFQVFRLYDRNRKRYFPVRAGNGATVAIGLLHVMVMLLDVDFIISY